MRLLDAFGRLNKPNSPNKTHFMVEVSPAFMLLASSKEQGRLQAMLPYKSLSLSSMKDKRGVYALIGKEMCIRDRNMTRCINRRSAVRGLIGWWGSTPPAFSPCCTIRR